MENTSLTLLARLQQSDDTEAWQRLYGLYHPLILNWLKRYGVQHSDADDLSQEVLTTISKELVRFDHNGRIGAFRSWLKGILINRLRTFWRARDRRPPRSVPIDWRVGRLAFGKPHESGEGFSPKQYSLKCVWEEFGQQ